MGRKIGKLKKVIFTIGMIFILSGSLHALGGGDQGFGLMIGNPSGLSGKFWLNEDVALDAAVGIARSEFDVHASFLVHNDWFYQWGWIRPQANFDFPVYYGVGPRLLFEGEHEFGLRFPVGAE